MKIEIVFMQVVLVLNLLAPFFVLGTRGFKIGLLSILLWVPIVLAFSYLYAVGMGCGHGSGKGGICDEDWISIVALGVVPLITLGGFIAIIYYGLKKNEQS